MGPHDKGAHTYKNKKTDRTKPFWNPGGCIYVYSIYMPNYFCVNIVANDENTPQAVLIRAVEPFDKQTESYVIKKNNDKEGKKKIINERTCFTLFDGPVKSCRSMEIDKSFNNIDTTTSDIIGIFKEKNEKEYEYLFNIDNESFEVTKKEDKSSMGKNKVIVECSKRVNIDYAEEYTHKLWRFYVKDNTFVSKHKFKK